MIPFTNLGAGKEKGHHWTDSKLEASTTMCQKLVMRMLKSFQGKLKATITGSMKNRQGDKAKRVELGERRRTEGWG